MSSLIHSHWSVIRWWSHGSYQSKMSYLQHNSIHCFSAFGPKVLAGDERLIVFIQRRYECIYPQLWGSGQTHHKAIDGLTLILLIGKNPPLLLHCPAKVSDSDSTLWHTDAVYPVFTSCPWVQQLFGLYKTGRKLDKIVVCRIYRTAIKSKVSTTNLEPHLMRSM